MNSLKIFAKYIGVHEIAKISISRETNYMLEISRSRTSNYILCLYFKSLNFFTFQTAEIGLNFGHFSKIAHKVAKSIYFSNI